MFCVKTIPCVSFRTTIVKLIQNENFFESYCISSMCSNFSKLLTVVCISLLFFIISASILNFLGELNTDDIFVNTTSYPSPVLFFTPQLFKLTLSSLFINFSMSSQIFTSNDISLHTSFPSDNCPSSYFIYLFFQLFFIGDISITLL